MMKMADIVAETRKSKNETDLEHFIWLKKSHLPHWYARWGEYGWAKKRGPRFDFGVGTIYERTLEDGTVLRLVQRGSADRDYFVIPPGADPAPKLMWWMKGYPQL